MSRTFAENLRLYRNMLGLTQTELAKAVGITRSAVNNYEAAQSEPSFEVLCKFADVLGVELTALIQKRLDIPNYIRTAQITDDESALLQAYRGADPVYQTVALEILRGHQQ